MPPGIVGETTNAAVLIQRHVIIHSRAKVPPEASTIITAAPYMPPQTWLPDAAQMTRCLGSNYVILIVYPLFCWADLEQVQFCLWANWFCLVHFKHWETKRKMERIKLKRKSKQGGHIWSLSSKCIVIIAGIILCEETNSGGHGCTDL